uniref:Uncharacterized protein n=1 Tax=Anguilla anguilla TaxID=7936 RepID=A0A0E9TQ44_ANGAN
MCLFLLSFPEVPRTGNFDCDKGVYSVLFDTQQKYFTVSLIDVHVS